MSCEKCWSDAYRRTLATGKSQGECYQELMDERKDHPCTPDQQCGVGTTEMHASTTNDGKCACGRFRH